MNFQIFYQKVFKKKQICSKMYIGDKMHTYVVEYLNENEFNKKTRALKKYNMLAYKKLIFDCFQ